MISLEDRTVRAQDIDNAHLSGVNYLGRPASIILAG